MGEHPGATVTGLSEYECLAVLTEEVGECASSTRETTRRKEEELIQVMASAMLWLEVEYQASQGCQWCASPTAACALHDE